MRLFTTLLLSISILSLCAQNSCDSLSIQSIQYSPFSDTLIVVEVINTSFDIFDYPGFVVINENGDTLAKETVNYFGISAQSTHLLQVTPNLTNPITNYTGELELHTGFYTDLACTWPISQSFCPPNNCADLVIGLQNWGGALVVGDFTWTVTDSLNITVGSGNFTMTANVQFWNDTLCLPPGQYSYQLQALTTPSGGGPTMTASNSVSFAAPTLSQYFDWYNPSSMEIPFYLHCASSTPNSIDNHERLLPNVILKNGTVRLSDRSLIQSLKIISPTGQLISRQTTNANVVSIPSDLSSGIYILLIRSEASKIIQHKMMIR